MFGRAKARLNERFLVERGINQLKVVGPGWVWFTPGQRYLATLNVGPQGQSFVFEQVETVEKVPLEINVQLLFRVDPGLFTDDLLPSLQGLSEGGWLQVLRWQTEHVLRQMMADYSWQDIGRENVKSRLERQLAWTLAERVRGVGVNLTSVCLIKQALPVGLEKTLVRAVQDRVEVQGRLAVLQEYQKLLGPNLPQAMPYLVQWELLTMLHRSGNLQLLSTAKFPTDSGDAGDALSNSMFQITLPMPPTEQKVEVEM
jgi:hypothetical protein